MLWMLFAAWTLAVRGQDTARAAVARFHAALAAGDSAAALGLLAPDALILESGTIETREEYRSGHLAADIEFAKVTTHEPAPASVTERGDAAWVSTAGRTTGTFRGRAVDVNSAELMVLTRTPEGWRIAAVHWSSRSRAR